VSAAAEDVPNLRPNVILSWLPVVLTVVGPLLTLVWMASKYPDRGEFNGAVKELHQLQLDMVRTSSDSASGRAGVERLEGRFQRIEDQIANLARRHK
jgi:hypothetical protein